MTQEESHPDQEGHAHNRRRRQSGQVTEQGAPLSGRPTGLPARTAVTSLPALTGVTADEHWVIHRGPTYALLLTAIGRRPAPSLLRPGPARWREAGRPARPAGDLPGACIPEPATARVHETGRGGPASALAGPAGDARLGRPAGCSPSGSCTPLAQARSPGRPPDPNRTPRHPSPWQDPRRGRRIRAGPAPAPPCTSRSPGLFPGCPGGTGRAARPAGPAGRAPAGPRRGR